MYVQLFLVLDMRGRGEGKAISFLLKCSSEHFACMWFFMMVQTWTSVSKKESFVPSYEKFFIPLISDSEDQARKVHLVSQQGGRGCLTDGKTLGNISFGVACFCFKHHQFLWGCLVMMDCFLLKEVKTFNMRAYTAWTWAAILLCIPKERLEQGHLYSGP